MSDPAWRFFAWMRQPSKPKERALRFFFWITPRWLSEKFQLYMLRRIVEHNPAAVDRSIRESARESAREMRQRFEETDRSEEELLGLFGTTGWSEEEIVALYKQTLALFMDPQALKRAREQARKGDFSQFGPHH